MTKIAGIAGAMVILLGVCPLARADEPGAVQVSRAREAWKVGKRLFQHRRYARAMKQFTRGHQLTGRGGFLYNMAECARALGDRERATSLYARYLRDFPRGKHRARAHKRCRALGAIRCEAKVAPKKNLGTALHATRDDGLPRTDYTLDFR